MLSKSNGASLYSATAQLSPGPPRAVPYDRCATNDYLHHLDSTSCRRVQNPESVYRRSDKIIVRTPLQQKNGCELECLRSLRPLHICVRYSQLLRARAQGGRCAELCARAGVGKGLPHTIPLRSVPAARFTALVLALFAMSAEAFNFGGKPKPAPAPVKSSKPAASVRVILCSVGSGL